MQSVSGEEFCEMLVAYIRREGDRLLNGGLSLSLTSDWLAYLNVWLPEFVESEHDAPDFTPGQALDAGPHYDNVASLFEVIQQLPSLRLIGGRNASDTTVDISWFRNLRILEIQNIPLRRVKGIDRVRSRMRRITCHSAMDSFDDLFGSAGADNLEELRPWSKLIDVDCSFNNLTALQPSLRMLACVRFLNLAHNQLESLDDNLKTLWRLDVLNLSFNRLRSVSRIHTVIGNIKELYLRSNDLSCISGLERLCALVLLDVRDNALGSPTDLQALTRLPELRVLLVEGNPLTAIPDYRVRTFGPFGERAREIELDGVPPTSDELDIVLLEYVVMAPRVRIASTPVRISSIADDQVPSTTTSSAQSSPPNAAVSATAVTSVSSPSPRRRSSRRKVNLGSPSKRQSESSNASADLLANTVSPRRKPSGGSRKHSKSTVASSSVDGSIEGLDASNVDETAVDSRGANESAEEFANRINSLREEGGSRWLIIYNNELDALEKRKRDAEEEALGVSSSSYDAAEGHTTSDVTPGSSVRFDCELGKERMEQTESALDQPQQLVGRARSSTQPISIPGATKSSSQARRRALLHRQYSNSLPREFEFTLPASNESAIAHAIVNSYADSKTPSSAPTTPGLLAAISSTTEPPLLVDDSAAVAPVPIDTDDAIAEAIRLKNQWRPPPGGVSAEFIVDAIGSGVKGTRTQLIISVTETSIVESDVSTANVVDRLDLTGLVSVKEIGTASGDDGSPHPVLLLEFSYARGMTVERRYLMENDPDVAEFIRLLRPVVVANERRTRHSTQVVRMNCIVCGHTFDKVPDVDTCPKCAGSQIIELSLEDKKSKAIGAELSGIAAGVPSFSFDSRPSSLLTHPIKVDERPTAVANPPRVSTPPPLTTAPSSGTSTPVPRGSPLFARRNSRIGTQTPELKSGVFSELSGAGASQVTIVRPTRGMESSAINESMVGALPRIGGAQSRLLVADTTGAGGPVRVRAAETPTELATATLRQEKFMPLVDEADMTSLDHTWQLYYSLKHFASDAERFQFQLATSFLVAQDTTTSKPSDREQRCILMVSSAALYVFVHRESRTSAPVERQLTFHSSQPLSSVLHIDTGLGKQSLRVEFPTAIYVFLIRDTAQCQTCVMLLGRCMSQVDDVRLSRINHHPHPTTLRHIARDLLTWPAPESAEQTLVVPVCLLVRLREHRRHGEHVPVTLLCVEDKMFLCDEDYQWPPAHEERDSKHQPKGQQFRVRSALPLQSLATLELSMSAPTALALIFDDGVSHDEWHLLFASHNCVLEARDRIAAVWQPLFQVELDIRCTP